MMRAKARLMGFLRVGTDLQAAILSAIGRLSHVSGSRLASELQAIRGAVRTGSNQSDPWLLPEREFLAIRPILVESLSRVSRPIRYGVKEARIAAGLFCGACVDGAIGDGRTMIYAVTTLARFRATLAQIVALAQASDIAALQAFEINPVSSSPKAMARYRDLCVIAIAARAQVAA